MKNLNFNFNAKEINLSSTNKNLEYSKLYSELSKNKVSFTPKDFRKKFRNLEYDENIIFLAIQSGFYNDNKEKESFAVHANKFDSFIAKYSEKETNSKASKASK